jgi:flagellar secretion chaperone FliS
MLSPYRAYVQTDVNTASQARLVFMLYGGALKFINEAKQAIADRRVADAHGKINRTIDIVEELRNSLDMQAGGSIAANLDSLYDFVLRRLFDADMKKDASILDEARLVLDDLREAWAGICTATHTSSTSASPALSAHA